MSDIVERLRSEIDYDCKDDAADEIERLREEIERLLVRSCILRGENERLKGIIQFMDAIKAQSMIP